MSLFTVEQIELIRRLRISGVTAVQIIEAFNTFDRLDQELSSVGNGSRNMSAILPHMLAPSLPYVSTPNSIFSNGIGQSPDSPSNGHMPKLTYQPMFHHQLSATANLINLPEQTVIKDDQDPPQAVDCYNDQQSWQNTADHLDDSSGLNNSEQSHSLSASPRRVLRASIGSSSSRSRGHSTSVSVNDQKPVIRSLTEQIDLSDPDLLAQANEMMKQEEMCIAEMREYVTSHQLRQQAIAQMCGISQPYVSKFLNGCYRELSERVRRIIFYWFATAKKNSPDFRRIIVQANSPSSGDSSQLKRERFIFKPVHVRLLEKYFAQDPYPNISKREEISQHLNHSYLAHKGTVSLDGKESVSEHVVGTWFSNRRKEKKRKDMKFRQMRVNQSGGQKSLLNTFLSNLRQSALERSEQSQAAITVDDNLEEDSAYSDGEPITSENNGKSTEITDELNAVNDSVYALLNPYSDDNQENHVEISNEGDATTKSLETSTA